jgi:galactokinase
VRAAIIESLRQRWGALGAKSSNGTLFFCPGRVNLIGEHIDYNGGLVFPLAIEKGVYALHSRRTDGVLTIRSLNRPGDEHTLQVKDIPQYRSEHSSSWVAYPLATLEILASRGVTLSGADMLFYGDLPLGSGLSSSAAIEVLTGYMSMAAGTSADSQLAEVDRVPLALDCQRAEREKIGVQCGIMDQFSVAMARQGTAMALNCATLEHTFVPLKLEEYRLVVIDSKKERTLAGSKYNERRIECERSVDLIRRERQIENLCQATLAEVESVLSNEPVLQKRARHVVSENLRVLNAVEALKNGDLRLLGELLYQSHDSLRVDYEVTGLELDSLVEISSSIPGCIGARMTGAGFGGCVIALVETQGVGSFEREVVAKYKERTGRDAELFSTSAMGGVGQLAV